MLEQLRQLFTPQIEAQALQAALSRLRQGLPPPVIWLFGKVQSGKTAIIRALTGAERARLALALRPVRAGRPGTIFLMPISLLQSFSTRVASVKLDTIRARTSPRFKHKPTCCLSLSGPWIWPLSNS